MAGLTKREFLTNIYNEFIFEIEKVSTQNILPDKLDIEDMLFYFNLYFSCEDKFINDKIQELYEMQQIELDEIKKEQFINVCVNFVFKVKNFLNQY
jgi:hypothetical protein